MSRRLKARPETVRTRGDDREVADPSRRSQTQYWAPGISVEKTAWSRRSRAGDQEKRDERFR
jgi:hypothetical protein